ncbi:hypothetical protein P9173_13780 [Bacillus safensis]|uniref:hypothetical protein n=1 Tax=Bacillus safensis TaxID=561879 RepID=UPI0022825219|nr:hypothetical protein [Bacillus safensis]MCY7542196.1 hypothetical protein [Bacillus safensis]MCY7551816.1 hypothetical protein [Bacillus safensis]MCY7644622.1 hypothetical protein [Bacillus safensis]MCY7654593.1 hypothetical protein [Bacillus safensis]MEC3711234.1 hypothetical protein [Bacillus safensis]
MSLPKHVELSQAVKACKNKAMTIDAAAAEIRVPDYVVPMLVRKNDDLIIEGNVVMAKRESNGPVIFTLLFFMAVIVIAGLLGN